MDSRVIITGSGQRKPKASSCWSAWANKSEAVDIKKELLV
jgi:hypothetical protein